jgi:hypothetical protein
MASRYRPAGVSATDLAVYQLAPLATSHAGNKPVSKLFVFTPPADVLLTLADLGITDRHLSADAKAVPIR